jgi:hypothetical protein
VKRFVVIVACALSLGGCVESTQPPRESAPSFPYAFLVPDGSTMIDHTVVTVSTREHHTVVFRTTETSRSVITSLKIAATQEDLSVVSERETATGYALTLSSKNGDEIGVVVLGDQGSKLIIEYEATRTQSP